MQNDFTEIFKVAGIQQISISLYQALHIKPDQSYEKIPTQRSN